MAPQSPNNSAKRRQPLAALHNAAYVEGRRAPSAEAKTSGPDASLHEISYSPAQKKPRPSASKRVSFGGEQIKLFDHEHDADIWDDSPPQNSIPNAATQPSPVRPSEEKPKLRSPSRRSPLPSRLSTHSPRRSPRFSRQPGGPRPSPRSPAGLPLADREDTLTLPNVLDMLRDQQAESDGVRAPTSSPTLSPQHPLSPFTPFMDEDVTVGAEASRLSVINSGAGNDETTLGAPIPAPAVAVKGSRRESVLSNASDGDITHQMPAMNELIDLDEAYGTSSSAKDVVPTNQEGSVEENHDQFSSVDDVTVSMGDVTSEAPPLASLLAADTSTANASSEAQGYLEAQTRSPSRSAIPEHQQSPSSAKCDGRQSVGDITLGMPSLQALADSDEPDLATDPSLMNEQVHPSDEIEPGKPSEQSPGKSDPSNLGKQGKDEQMNLPEKVGENEPKGSDSSSIGSAQYREPIPSKEELATHATQTAPVERTILPESRKLFSTDHEGDEDTTIHYHDAGVKVLPGMQANHQVPSHPAHPVPPDASLDKGGKQKCESPFSGPSSEKVGNSNMLTVERFCDSLNLVFRHKEFSRCESMGQALRAEVSEDETTDGNPEIAQRQSKFKLMHSATRTEKVINILHEAIKQMQDEVARRQLRIEELTRVIEHSPPRYFARLAESDKLKPSEFSKMQLEFKRLQKASTKNAAREHAQIRQKREHTIAKSQKEQVASLIKDKEATLSQAKRISSAHTDIIAYIARNNLSGVVTRMANGQVDPAVTATLRSEVVDHSRAIAAAVGRIREAVSSKDEMHIECKSLEERNTELVDEVRRIRSFARASSKADLDKLVAESRDSHLLLSAITGIVPLALAAADAHFRLLGAVDVRFGLQGKVVTSIDCFISSNYTEVEMSSPFGQFVNHAVALVSERCLKRVELIDEIPSVLQLTVLFLMQVFKVDYSLRHYTRVHEATYTEASFITSSDAKTGGEPGSHSNSSSPVAELKLNAEYYSLRQHCKFDLSLSLVLSAPAWKAPHVVPGELRTRVDEVHNIIGQCPACEDIRNLISSQKVACSRYPILDALESVWTMLD